MPHDHIHFVTGKLAAPALRRVVSSLAQELDFCYTIDILPITVAALMTPAWIARKIDIAAEATRVLLPGYCGGDLTPVEQAANGRPVERGPRDLRRLPEFFGRGGQSPENYGDYSIEIIAEINHCPRLTREEILQVARHYHDSGANVIDLGCDPGGPWLEVADAVRAVRDQGWRVSIDSLDPREIGPAVAAGAELVLSANIRNRQAAPDWGCEVVVIPDDPTTLGGFDETIEFLMQRNVPFRLDPIIEPIGFGFAASLGRYIETRRRYPGTPMLMGIGNLTELTEVDSAGVNTLLLGICQELGIGSILTTEVIHWAQSSVRECDIARRLMHHAIEEGVPPKHLDPRLLLLRGEAPTAPTGSELEELARSIKDNNYRVFVSEGLIHLISSGLHLTGDDAYTLWSQLAASGPEGTLPKNLDSNHAFYLGHELHKAMTALTLDKQYQQDEALDWGFLTRPEGGHAPTRRRAADDSHEGDAP